MIVVASHNSVSLLKSFLAKLSMIDLCNHDVLVVDTNSDDSSYLNEFACLIKQYPRFRFERKAYTCWDSGAYIHAYTNYQDTKYLFFQDSLEITNPNLIQEIDSRLDEVDVLAFANFKYQYDSEDQRNWVESDIEFTDHPEDGIFGPIFSVTRNTLDRIPKHWLKVPSNKLQGCGMERRWSLMFDAIGAKKSYMEYFKTHSDFVGFYENPSRYSSSMKKILVGRK